MAQSSKAAVTAGDAVAGEEAAAKRPRAKKPPVKRATPRHDSVARSTSEGDPAAVSANGSTADAPAARRSSAGRSSAGRSSAGTSGAGAVRAADESASTADATTSAPTLPVREGEEPWTAEELDEVRAELADEQERLHGEISAAEDDLAAMLRDAGDGAGDDQADAGSKTFEREHEMSLANNARDMLVQVAHAIHRISDGTYGVCESCGNPIGKARLQAFPRATLCLTCKQREERR